MRFRLSLAHLIFCAVFALHLGVFALTHLAGLGLEEGLLGLPGGLLVVLSWYPCRFLAFPWGDFLDAFAHGKMWLQEVVLGASLFFNASLLTLIYDFISSLLEKRRARKLDSTP